MGKTEHLSVTVLPSMGSKIVSLRAGQTHHEWLWQASSVPHNTGYDTPYEDADGSGWDEMFPSIDACRYPSDPWKGLHVPDHGEVWSVPWDVKADEGQLSCLVVGVRFPYQLSKQYTFPDSHTLRIDYQVKNLSASAFSFLWAAHPLFAVPPGTHIELPTRNGEQPHIEVAHSLQQRLGDSGSVWRWPIATGPLEDIQLDAVPPLDVTGVADKFYLQSWASGEVSLVLPGQTQRLRMRVDPALVPYLAVWLNYGGYRQERNVALEPATGWMDSLERAVRSDRCTQVAPNSTYQWWMEIECTGEVPSA